MKVSHLTIDSSSSNLIVLQVALQLYLRQFSDATINSAHPESAIGEALRTYNRLRNISFGSHVDYDINRLHECTLGNGVTVTEWRNRNA